MRKPLHRLRESQPPTAVDLELGTRYFFRSHDGITLREPDSHRSSGAANAHAPAQRSPQRSRSWEIASAKGRRSPVGESDLRTEPERAPRHDCAHLPDILPRHQFLKQLQRERRRSDRFKAPLSIALFRFDDSDAATSDCVDDGLRLIHRSMRETDILGYLNNNLVAILLPHTNAQGAQKFIQKVAGRADPSRYACTAGTYPDRVFDSLADGARKPPELDVLFLDDRATPRFVNLIKRGIDILGATTAIILLSPVMLGTAAAIAITSPGPVIYRQKRLGRRGVPFVFYKFRSMHSDADSIIHREHVTTIIKGSKDTENSAANTAWSKLESDPRITPIGRVIRKTSIDELPQLFSVLKGDMSLVGPRPPLPYEAEVYEPWHLRRMLEIRPGITGLWQVGGRGRVSFDDMVRMDLRYIRDWSLALDFKILARTVKVVLRREGAT